MKIAQEIRAGNVIMHGKDPMVVLKAEYARGGRNAATVRMKFKTHPLNQGEVANELRRRLMTTFVGRGIKPFA